MVLILVVFVTVIDERNAKDVPEFSDTVGFVNIWLGDINGCRAIQVNRKPGNNIIEECSNLLARINFCFTSGFIGCLSKFYCLDIS
jgi:hypothetical protein